MDDNKEQDQNESEGSCHRTNQDHVLSKDIKKTGPSALYRGRRSPVQHSQPPPPLTVDRNCSSTASISDSQMKDSSNDLLKSLSNWSKTERRGREDKSLPWAAQVLLSLSRGDDSARPNQILPDSNSGSTNGNSVNDSKKSSRHSISCMDERTGGFDMEKQRMKKLVIDETNGGKEQEYEESKNTKSGNSLSDEPSKDNYQIRTKEKMKMTKKVTSLVGHSETKEEEELGLINKTQKIPRSYKCRDCGKSYPTHQALGGHRSSHKVNKQEKTTNIASSVGDDQEEISPSDSFKTDETEESDEWNGEA